ncbi:MAG TPA: hypothetical protein VGB82_20700 [Alphaproteobacteria bacterium]
MLDQYVADQLAERIERINRQTPENIPGEFTWRFRAKDQRVWALRVVITRPKIATFGDAYNIEYEILSPAVTTPTGHFTLTVGPAQRPRGDTLH